jgi:hypothetical protein
MPKGEKRTIGGMADDERLVIAGGVALFLFLLLFAFGQLVEIFRAFGH